MQNHARANPSGVSPWPEQLREAGLRVTNQRIAALDYVDAHPHSTVDDILTAVRVALPTTTHQTIHGVVNDLVARSLMRRIELPSQPGGARYETRVGDNHHHIECVRCGRIADVDCTVGAAPCLTPSDSHGMRVLEAQVTYLGVCAACEQQLGEELS